MPFKMNIQSKPFLVIEAIVDSSECIHINTNQHNFGTYILYAGGIDLKYGIMELIESFQNIKRQDIELILCGGGDFANTLKIICNEFNNIHFLGIKTPEEIFELQKSALLLVNPRMNNQEFVKYSFPSKVVESMYSGTPLVHHMLPGIPEEYYEFSFVFSGDKVSDMTDTFNSLLSLTTDKLNEMGKSAKQFVSREKSAKIQTKKIIDFIAKF
jgi:glycosyltransferase involved in cell wall biosynthesis